MYTNVYRNCKWLIEKFLKQRYLSLKDINELWIEDTDMSGGVEMDRKTFKRYKDKLRDSFGIDIFCIDGGNYAYYINNPEILKNKSLTDFMLNTLAMNEKLLGCKSLANRIMFENVPSGGRTLDHITDAMLHGCKLRFDYSRYGLPEMKDHTVEPWGLVLSNQRWYIVASFGDEKKYTFSLDRMRSTQITAEKFKMDPTFNAEDYFSEFYGIYNSGRNMEKIVFRAFGDESYYLRDLPIHKSQREIGMGDGYTDFMVELRPNNELIAYFLSRKDRLKVLSPATFVTEMKGTIENMMQMYS